MSARTRRGLTVAWTVLFLCSLLMQYASFSRPADTLAVHGNPPGTFELDGDAIAGGAPGDDWSTYFPAPGSGGGSAFATLFITDPINGVAAEHLFTGGDSKDIKDISAWRWTSGPGVQDKNDIAHAFAAGYDVGGDLVVYFGLDRYASNGDAQVGFWFIRSNFGENPDGTFSGIHSVGDLLVQFDFENGGANPIMRIYEWVGSGGDTSGTLQLVAAGGNCSTTALGDARCVITNTGNVISPWPFTDKFAKNSDPANQVPPGGFVEGGINLTALGLDEGCFASFIAETRSSQEPTSTLSDYTFGRFSLCEEPNLTTQVSTSAISVGDAGVVDTASLSGSKGVPTGTVDFFLCGPTTSAQACTTGGTDAGQDKPINGSGEAFSNAISPTAPGWYCFRAEYTPSAGSKYLATSHTNATTECFQVLPANVTISKTADAATVSAGSQIGFTITWGNSGAGEAKGVVVSDNLPGAAGLDWSIESFTGSGSTCSISGAVGSEVLTCNVGSIPGSTANHGSVHLVSGTTAASCGVVNNTGNISSTNDGSGQSSAGITVQCPDIRVTKTPDGQTINAGDPISFSITVENLGPGTATGVVLTDNLPADIDWSTSTAGCSISGAVGSEVLTCNVGTLASGASFTAVVSGTTDDGDCGRIDNTGSATATNEPSNALGNNSDTGDVTVLCAQIQIFKVADPAGPVSAGDTIGFDITVTNGGAGTAVGVVVTDNLPGNAGLDWSIDSVTGDTVGVVCGISGAVGSEVLTCTDGSMTTGQSFTVRVSSGTTAASCAVIDNTASVTTTNDGSAEDDASVTVLCAEISIVKTADADDVVAGNPIGFTITVTNNGAGTAYGVEVTDTLPAGFAWQIDAAGSDPGWSIVGGVLGYGPASLASGASASVHVVADTTFEDCGLVDNSASVTTTNNGSDEDGASLSVRCPGLGIDKTHDDADGIVGHGQTVEFTLIVFVAEGPVTNAVVTDVLPAGQTYVSGSQSSTPAETAFDVSADGRTLTWTWASLASGATITYEVTIDADAPTGDQTNTAEVCVSELPDCASDDATVTVPELTIVKSFTGNTGGETPDGFPEALEGDVLTYTLAYTLTNGPVTNGVITDTLPVGLAYIDGSAAGNAEFTFSSFDAVSRTLTWNAPVVTASGSVTYQVLVLDGAAELAQPLVNVATIDSDETDVDEDDAQVFVEPPPLVATGTPVITPPPTSTIDGGTDRSNPGFTLMLILLALAGLVFGVGYVTPVPARVRRPEGRR